MLLMRSITWPMRCPEFRKLGDFLVGPVCLLHGLARDRAAFLHLPADLRHGRRKLLGSRRRALHIDRCLLGSSGHHSRKLLGGLGGVRQRRCRAFEFARGSGDGFDDAANCGLELIGELQHGGLASRFGSPFIGGLMLRLVGGSGLEFLDCGGDAADLVLAADAGQHDVEIPACELPHGVGDPDERCHEVAD